MVRDGWTGSGPIPGNGSSPGPRNCRRAQLYQQALSVSLEDLQDDIQDMEDRCREVIELKDQEADEKQSQSKGPKTAQDARRDALRAMTRDQLLILWGAQCEGPPPQETEDLVEGIAKSLE